MTKIFENPTKCVIQLSITASVTTVAAVSHELTVSHLGEIIRSQCVCYTISGLVGVTNTV